MWKVKFRSQKKEKGKRKGEGGRKEEGRRRRKEEERRSQSKLDHSTFLLVHFISCNTSYQRARWR
tara:strand:+ start:115 stop:309 length:195 start_codon:yes stop_codon:yes gene_type:complete